MENAPSLFPEFDEPTGSPKIKKKRGRPRKNPISASTSPFEKNEKWKIIKSFLKEGVEPDWPKEMRCFNVLYRRYPSVSFWRGFSLPYKIHSIIWFLGEGKKDVQRAYWLYQLDFKAKQYTVETGEKVGDDYKPKNKQLSIREILTS